MPMPGRLIMGALALCAIYGLVHAWRTGWINSGAGWGRFYADDNPIMYTLMVATRIFIFALCVACAAGYTPAEFLDMVGLGWLNPYMPHGHA
jgi:hypothetical protein